MPDCGHDPTRLRTYTHTSTHTKCLDCVKLQVANRRASNPALSPRQRATRDAEQSLAELRQWIQENQ